MCSSVEWRMLRRSSDCRFFEYRSIMYSISTLYHASGRSSGLHCEVRSASLAPFCWNNTPYRSGQFAWRHDALSLASPDLVRLVIKEHNLVLCENDTRSMETRRQLYLPSDDLLTTAWRDATAAHSETAPATSTMLHIVERRSELQNPLKSFTFA